MYRDLSDLKAVSTESDEAICIEVGQDHSSIF